MEALEAVLNKLEKSSHHRRTLLLESSSDDTRPLTEHNVKVVMLGESGAGKSSLALRFAKNQFTPYNYATIGASFFSKTVECNNNTQRVSFQIWDTAGQEKYHALAPMYYRGAQAAILTFDICRGVSFQTLQKWVDKLRDHGPQDIVLCICGNKLDLKADRTVRQSDAKYYANKVGAMYIETSAQEGINVQELFLKLAKKVISAREGKSSKIPSLMSCSSSSSDDSSVINLKSSSFQSVKSGYECC